MTLAEIKLMFAPGQQWHATRSGGGKHSDETRMVSRVMGSQIVFKTPDGKDYWTTLPKAREVLEAAPGFLRFFYDDTGVEVTLRLLPQGAPVAV